MPSSSAAYTRMTAGSRTQIAKLTLDLGVHLERLLALPQPALVAGHHELADLLAQGGVPRGRRAGQLVELGLHVERLLAASLPPGGLGLQHLPDLLARL